MALNIKTVINAFIVSAVFCLGIAPPAFAENLLSLQVGAYSPGGDYPDNKDNGGDFGIFYTNTNNRLGFELGMHGYRARAGGNVDIGVVGAELLLTFQDPMATVQPYAGIGVGVYSVEADYDTGLEHKHNGNGFVVEVGVRGYLEGIFIGFQIKGFTNENDEAGPLPERSDYGGVSADLIVGVIF